MPFKDAGDSNPNSRGKNNGSPYEGGQDDEGNLGACDVFVSPDGEVTQVITVVTAMEALSAAAANMYRICSSRSCTYN